MNSSKIQRIKLVPCLLLVMMVCLYGSLKADQEFIRSLEEGTFMYSRETFTYKQVGDLEILADVYRYPDSKSRPVVMWIHGGALIYGSRINVPTEQFEKYMKAGFTIVSIDYRLAPDTKLAFIIGDLEKAYDWVRTVGPDAFNIDPDRIAVMGISAGG